MENPTFTNTNEQYEGSEKVQTGDIIVCIGEKDQHKDSLPEGISRANSNRRKGIRTTGVDNVAFAGENNYLDIQGISHNERHTGSFLISEANANDKLSESYFSCIGLIVVGKVIDQDKNISILVHTPIYDTDDSKFLSALNERLREVKDSVEYETIDAITFGGRINDNDPKMAASYAKGMSEISAIVSQELGVRPRLAAEPKSEKVASDDVYFDTQKRRLYFMQNMHDNSNL